MSKTPRSNGRTNGGGSGGSAASPSSSSQVRQRCAVYTRKSSEEGLDQAFNSLDAQREACVAYIASQASLGWKLVPEHYDDGGISGGTLERPGIQRLLQHIKDGKVDVVVVYKIDRLTRSLTDFARLVEVFDGHAVSFVSVTQQFNTTTSMGRLTLNVLLSFAQFEREVTAERIRDKIAASKQKGMWMGGSVPFGYRAEHRMLVVDTDAGHEVRHIFKRYLELRSVDALVRELNAERATASSNEIRDCQKQARALHSRGKITYFLANPIYIGKIRHKDQLHVGQHEALIDPDTFEAVQQLLASNAASPKGSAVHADVHLLTGLLHDEDGHHLTPVHSRNHEKRYRYYVTDTRRSGSGSADRWRIAALTIEPIVKAQMIQLLKNRSKLTHWIEQHGNGGDLQKRLEDGRILHDRIEADQNGSLMKRFLRTVVQHITLASDNITYQINTQALIDFLASYHENLDGQAATASNTRHHRIAALRSTEELSPAAVEITQRIILKRRGVEMRIVVEDHLATSPSYDQTLIDMLATAHLALGALTDGSEHGIAQVAQSLAMDASDISRILPLAFLSPKLTEAILTGRQPPDLTLRKLTREIELPIEWSDQNELLVG